MNFDNDKFRQWLNPKVYELKIPILKIIEYYHKYKEYNKPKDYIWEYDSQFGDCDCIPLSGGYSNPYCKHYNKLRRIVK